MVPHPMAAALLLADLIIIDQNTHKVSLVNTFRNFRATSFPFTPPPFSVYAIMTDGMGGGTLTLNVFRLETDELLYTRDRPVHFPDRFAEVQVLLRLTNCVFPAPGAYLISLLVDQQWVAQRRVHVSWTGSQS